MFVHTLYTGEKNARGARAHVFAIETVKSGPAGTGRVHFHHHIPRHADSKPRRENKATTAGNARRQPASRASTCDGVGVGVRGGRAAGPAQATETVWAGAVRETPTEGRRRRRGLFS